MSTSNTKLIDNFKKRFKENRVAITLIVFGCSLKALYALSRDVFISGPDANGFIPSAENFDKYGFLSDKVNLSTIYSAGYPYFLANIRKVFGDNWFEASQLLQIVLFGISSYLFYTMACQLTSKKVATIVLIIISFHPAWLVATSMAMYETLLFFTTTTCIFILLKLKLTFPPNGSQKMYLAAAASGVLAGFAMLVHPRSILYIAPFLLISLILSEPRLNKLLIFFFALTPIALIGVLRTHADSRTWNLGGDFWTASWINKEPLPLCRDLKCEIASVLRFPMDYAQHLFTNFWYFVSPYSGPQVRGTWFHNISLQYQLYKFGYLDLAILISITIVVVGLLLVLGSAIIELSNKSSPNRVEWYAICTSITLVVLTDVFIYGDSRHRLIISPYLWLIISSSVSQILSNKFKDFSY